MQLVYLALIPGHYVIIIIPRLVRIIFVLSDASSFFNRPVTLIMTEMKTVQTMDALDSHLGWFNTEGNRIQNILYYVESRLRVALDVIRAEMDPNVRSFLALRIMMELVMYHYSESRLF